MRRLTLVLAGLMAAASVPTFGQVSLTEVNAASAISQDMQGRNARAATATTDGSGEQAQAQTSESVGMGGVKYIPAYAIVLMLVGLSAFMACRPSRRHSAD